MLSGVEDGDNVNHNKMKPAKMQKERNTYISQTKDTNQDYYL